METRVTRIGRDSRAGAPGDELTNERLSRLLEVNARIARDKALYRNDRERFEAAIMVRPLDAKDAFATFGLLIGSLPLATVSLRIAIQARLDQPGEQLITVLFALAALASGVVGFRIGKAVPSVIEKCSAFRFPNRLAIYSLIGIAWGAIAGVAGGVFLLLIGALFGGIVGGFIGAVTVPIFALVFEVLRRGDRVEAKHLVPVAVGISLTLCAFIAGY